MPVLTGHVRIWNTYYRWFQSVAFLTRLNSPRSNRHHIPKRPGAEADYTAEEIAQAERALRHHEREDKARLTRKYATTARRRLYARSVPSTPATYKDIDKAKSGVNILPISRKATIPVADAISWRAHGRSPGRSAAPYSGLPRIIST